VLVLSCKYTACEQICEVSLHIIGHVLQVVFAPGDVPSLNSSHSVCCKDYTAETTQFGILSNPIFLSVLQFKTHQVLERLLCPPQ